MTGQLFINWRSDLKINKKKAKILISICLYEIDFRNQDFSQCGSKSAYNDTLSPKSNGVDLTYNFC